MPKDNKQLWIFSHEKEEILFFYGMRCFLSCVELCQDRTRTVSEPYLLRTFFGQKYLCTEKLRTWYGASTARVRYKQNGVPGCLLIPRSASLKLQTRQGSQLPAISVRCLSNTWDIHLLNIKKNTSHPNVFPRRVFEDYIFLINLTPNILPIILSL